ncbi:MAG: DNA translocase FtsK 4TM domain-containing protein, partial [Gammaproteobacteria bacterium]|nr:DNA translocase FtsK 4TM domain-containing protein [Gammaproteobacteria bacterium]
AQTAFQKVLAHGGREGAVIGLVALTLYLAMALLSFNPVDPGWKSVGHDIDVVTNHAGRSGAFIASLLIALFGHVAYLFPISLGYFAWRVYKADLGTFSGPLFAIRLGGFVLVLLSATSILELYAVFGIDGASGGMLGQGVAGAMKGVFNLPATTLILVSVFLFSVTILTELSWIRLMDRLGSAVVAASQWLVGKAGEVRAAREARALRVEPEPPLVTPVAPSARKPVLADPPVLEDRVDSAAEPEASWLTRFKQQFARRSVESVAETARIEPALDQLDDAPAPRARVRGVERREPVWDESPETLSALDDVPVVGAQGRARAMPVLDEVVNAEPATTPRRAAAPAMSAEPPAKPVRIEPFKRVSVATDMEAATERRMPAVYEDGGGEIPPLTLLDPAEPNQRAG